MIGKYVARQLELRGVVQPRVQPVAQPVVQGVGA